MKAYEHLSTSLGNVRKNGAVFCLSKNKVLLLFYQLVSNMYHKMELLLFRYPHSLADCTYRMCR